LGAILSYLLIVGEIKRVVLQGPKLAGVATMPV